MIGGVGVGGGGLGHAACGDGKPQHKDITHGSRGDGIKMCALPALCMGFNYEFVIVCLACRFCKSVWQVTFGLASRFGSPPTDCNYICVVSRACKCKCTHAASAGYYNETSIFKITDEHARRARLNILLRTRMKRSGVPHNASTVTNGVLHSAPHLVRVARLRCLTRPPRRLAVDEPCARACGQVHGAPVVVWH